MSASIGSGTSSPRLSGRWQRLSRIWTRPASRSEAGGSRRLRDAHERLREVGLLAQRRVVEVAQKRQQFEQLDDAASEEVCALAGRLFLQTAAGGDHLEAWRQFTGQITPDDPELRQLLQAWRQLEHERRKKVLEFSQDQLALSLLRVEKAILGSVQTPEEGFEIARNAAAAATAENGRSKSYSRSVKRPSAKSKSGRTDAYGESEATTCSIARNERAAGSGRAFRRWLPRLG